MKLPKVIDLAPKLFDFFWLNLQCFHQIHFFIYILDEIVNKCSQQKRSHTSYNPLCAYHSVWLCDILVVWLAMGVCKCLCKQHYALLQYEVNFSNCPDCYYISFKYISISISLDICIFCLLSVLLPLFPQVLFYQ